jgi:hypothetical protein
MNCTNAEQTNLPIQELLRRSQTVVETVSGHALQKLRVELAHSVSESLFTSMHGNNNNDRYLNLVRTSHLPVSA